MNAAYINPFIVATRDLFMTMVRVPLGLGKPYLKERYVPQYRISAMIRISGPMNGLAVLSFSEPVALALASAMSGHPHQTIDRDAIDALGEIANLVAGSAKAKLPGGLSKLSPPSVVTDFKGVAYPPGVPVIVIPCDSGPGRFAIEIALRPDPAAATATVAA